jgi:hypothetical protein
MTTRLTVYGVPGQEQSFSPKTPATPTASQITSLSVLGTPGPLHSFLPKDPSGGGGKPSDQVTTLSVMATPSGLRVFLPKEPTVIPDSGGGKADRFHEFPWTEKQLYEEDEIILMIAALFMEMME